MKKQNEKNKQKNKICFRCLKIVNENDAYFSFTEFYSGEVMKIDYAHKTCWDDFLKQISNTDEAMNMLRGVKGTLTRMGMLPEEVVKV